MYIFPDNIADWDAISGWEIFRLRSMREHLKPGMKLYDVGTEHGWLTAVYGGFVGYENMVLIEPSPEFWVNIRKIWEANEFADPAFCWQGFIGLENTKPMPKPKPGWPECADSSLDEVPGMAYRYIGAHSHIVDTLTIDQLVKISKVIPDAITVDVEGAEFLVVRGAEQTLLKHRPLVWLSVHPDLMERDFGIERVEELFEFMTSVGYRREYLNTDHEQHHFFTPVEAE
jgi:FkbM family methyltransferase